LTWTAGALAPPAPTPLRNFLESRGFTFAVTIVIAINAVTLGLETWPLAMQTAGPLLLALDRLALLFFTAEI
jgi:voltage-gated sodium channel